MNGSRQRGGRVPAGLLFCLLTLGPPSARAEAPLTTESLPGPSLTVEDVRLEGVRVGRRTNLRDRIAVEPDTPLDEGVIEDARLRLLASGVCETVAVKLDRGSARGRVVVVFTCEERVTTILEAIHLGSARPTRFWAGAEFSDLDPFGVGAGIGAGVVASGDQLSARLSTKLPAPWIDDARVRLALRYVGGIERFAGPTGQLMDGEGVFSVPVPYRRAGFDAALDIDLGPFTRMIGGLRLEWAPTEVPDGATQIDRDGVERPFDFDAEGDMPFSVVLHDGITWDQRDDPAFPTRGMRAGFTARAGWFDGPWGGLSGRVEQYFLLPWNSVLRLDAFVGGLIGGAPFFERFFVGDLHPYIPGRGMDLNFSHRRGPVLFDQGGLSAARYETLAGRLGFEYRVPLGGGPTRDPYGVEFFVNVGLVSLVTPDEPGAFDDGPPWDLSVDVGLRFETEIGVMGLSVGNLFLLVEP